MENESLNEGASLETGEGPSTADLSSPPSQTQGGTPPTRSLLPHPRTLVIIGIGLALLLVIILGAGYLFIKKEIKSTPKPTPVTINTQTLDNGTLNKLSVKTNSETTSQQLTITPDTLFKNSLVVQGNLQTNNNLEVGGNTNIRGTTTMQGAVGIKGNLAVNGTLSVGGLLTAASLNVGSLGVSSINVSGSLNFGGHIIPNGATPVVTAGAASLGGKVSVSGNDSAGTITVNMGNGVPFGGTLATLTFRAPFATTPKVQLTPINGQASALNYFATRSPTFLTIETSSLPAINTTYVFDYLVTQ